MPVLVLSCFVVRFTKIVSKVYSSQSTQVYRSVLSVIACAGVKMKYKLLAHLEEALKVLYRASASEQLPKALYSSGSCSPVFCEDCILFFLS